MPDAFDTFGAFDSEVGNRAKRAATLAGAAARQAKALYAAAQAVDLRTLRQRAADAAARAAEAADAARELQQAVDTFELLPAAAEVAAASASGEAPPAGEAVDPEAGFARAFERICAAEGVPLEQSYPDYRVFPFDVRIRLSEERAIVGRRSVATLRPEALARTVKRERERVFGGSFAAERFGRSLVRAYDVLLPETRKQKGPATQDVSLREVLKLLQLGTFGRNSYTGDEYAFDLYRFRQTPMTTDGKRLMLSDARGWGTGIKVPNGRGSHDELTALRVIDTAPPEDAGER